MNAPAAVTEPEDVMASKAIGSNPVRVRISPAAHHPPNNIENLENLAYVIGLAIGDGNLSNPNGRATRLRISCDLKYPKLTRRIIKSLEIALPDNKVNIIRRPKNCIDVYVYSNKLEPWLGWKADKGPKHVQHVHVPQWIKSNKKYTTACLRGLFETDGSIYQDRGYPMSMFVTIIPELAEDTWEMITLLGFTAHIYQIKQPKPQQTRYNIRISKNTEQFIKTVGVAKN